MIEYFCDCIRPSFCQDWRHTPPFMLQHAPGLALATVQGLSTLICGMIHDVKRSV